jgi:hypothetical protein
MCSFLVSTSEITLNLLFDKAIVSAEVVLVHIRLLLELVAYKIPLLYRENSIFTTDFGLSRSSMPLPSYSFDSLAPSWIGKFIHDILLCLSQYLIS